MLNHRPCFRRLIPALALFGTLACGRAAEPQDFLGYWELTLPGGAPGWLGITHTNGYYDGSLLWAAGSVVPVSSVFFNGKADNQTLFVVQVRDVQRKNAAGKVTRTQEFPDVIMAQVDGDQLRLHVIRPERDGVGLDAQDFSGTRQPPLPPAPDLSQLKFGDPIKLFNGHDLTGWRLTNPSQVNGWSVEDGVLINRPVQTEGKPHKSYGNLRTDREFEDFNLTLDTRVPKDGNSGIYLRGIYEVQVADSYGKPLDPHNMGALYSRITPSQNAEKPANEWQHLDITLADRHLTVILNGKKIIDNQPVLGCTGGALWSDVTRPGPIYLQGDHMAVDYRNIVLRPIVK